MFLLCFCLASALFLLCFYLAFTLFSLLFYLIFIEKRLFFIVFRYFFSVFLVHIKKYLFICISKNDNLLLNNKLYKDVSSMKKAFMSITVLVISLSMLMAFLCGIGTAV